MDRPTFPLFASRLAQAAAVLLLSLASASTVCAALPGLAAPAAPAADAAAAPKSTTPDPIPAGDIPMRADIDERYAQDVTARAKGRDPSTRLGQRLDELTAGIVNLSQTTAKEDLQQLSALRLESLDNHWGFYQREMDEWRDSLDSTTSYYTEAAAELAQRRAVWEVTRDSLKADGVTAALVDRVNVILGQFKLAETALSRPLDEQLKLRRRANIVQASIDAGRKEVAAAITYYDRRLGTIDAPPVWRAIDDTKFTTSELKGAESGLRLETAFLGEWEKANQKRLQAYRVGSLALLPLLLWLS